MSSSASDQAEYGILVGFDGSPGSEHALRWAVKRSDSYGPVQPLTTWHSPWWTYPTTGLPLEKEFAAVAQITADAAAKATGQAELLPPIVLEGKAGPTMVEAGKAAELIVVGTRGRSGLKDTLLGSVSSHIVAHATVPVAVVPLGASLEPTDEAIVVGVDESDNSMQALLWAIKHSSPDATIHAVHTWVYPPTMLPDTSENVRDSFEAVAQRSLDRVIAQANAATPQEQRRQLVGHLECGDARHVLRSYAESADLLVLGERGHGGIANLLLGSVTSALVHQPLCTTVVVPNSGRRPGSVR